MIPLFDDDSDRRTFPVVNYFFIAINIYVFIMYQAFGHNLGFTYSFATVPGEILTGHDLVSAATYAYDPATGQQIVSPGLGITPIPVWFTLITSMFLHGGLAHLAGNMLYLWIFGDNLEDKMGHVNYFFFYLLCGVIASLTHVLSSFLFGENLLTPSIGASGAISAVMGGYLLLFPTRRVTVLLLIFFVTVPAFVVLGLWILLQVASGTGYLGSSEVTGIAYAAHIGGFFAGMLLVKKFIPERRL
ncbi:rhomboid family intramembrane serine protease [Ginsengibacter hankyongi]|uniref:Rhomboid family intramembrane serine protease n=1 Tax=Ginsengibacter hankyongi TaxID=2607284 RepID=A0A5J5IDW7_9BACT|nr:rhomboid family intramembrane serine protease [Ginsengibacter hankyongi]KAA9037608.1 rhomboid family intramembrane serine protease [Ginsengibacter hankyongi]